MGRDPESLLQVLQIHLGCGQSLRKTAVRTLQAGLTDLLGVALMERRRRSKAWPDKETTVNRRKESG